MGRILPLLLACAALMGCSEESATAGADSGRADARSTDARSADAIGKPPVALTPKLCSDPSKMATLLGALGSAGGSPSYGKLDMTQLQRMIAAPTKGPFYMVNLIHYRDKAKYPDGRKTNLTGRQANALYSPLEFIAAIGAKVVFAGGVTRTTQGKAGTWHDVAIVEYPCPLALFAMSAHPGFQARSVHKDAGVEATIVMVTHLQALADVKPTKSPHPPTASDPAFELVKVIRHRGKARYEAGSKEPSRTGREAMKLYASSISKVEQRLGVYAKARLKVEGVFIGDGRAWDEVWIDYMPSRAASNALAADAAVVAAERHRKAAIEEAYGLAISPMLSSIPRRLP